MEDREDFERNEIIPSIEMAPVRLPASIYPARYRNVGYEIIPLKSNEIQIDGECSGVRRNNRVGGVRVL